MFLKVACGYSSLSNKNLYIYKKDYASFKLLMKFRNYSLSANSSMIRSFSAHILTRKKLNPKLSRTSRLFNFWYFFSYRWVFYIHILYKNFYIKYINQNRGQNLYLIYFLNKSIFGLLWVFYPWWISCNIFRLYYDDFKVSKALLTIKVNYLLYYANHFYFKVLKKVFKLFRSRRYSLCIRRVKNNIHVTVVDYHGNVIFKKSAGCVGYKKGRDRVTLIALKSIIISFIDFLDKNSSVSVLKLKSFEYFDNLFLNNMRASFVKALLSFFYKQNKERFINAGVLNSGTKSKYMFSFSFASISVSTRYSHGNMRWKKKRIL